MARQRRPKETLKVGDVIVGKVASVRPFGCFVELGENKTGLIHVSEIIDEDSLDTLADMNLEQGQKVEVVVAEINEKKREYKLRPSEKALKAMIPEEEAYVEESSIPPASPFLSPSRPSRAPPSSKGPAPEGSKSPSFRRLVDCDNSTQTKIHDKKRRSLESEDTPFLLCTVRMTIFFF